MNKAATAHLLLKLGRVPQCPSSGSAKQTCLTFRGRRLLQRDCLTIIAAMQKLINDAEASVQQALARNCYDLLAALPEVARVDLFGQMRAVVAESRCAWRIRLAMADQLGSIALLFSIEVSVQ